MRAERFPRPRCLNLDSPPSEGDTSRLPVSLSTTRRGRGTLTIFDSANFGSRYAMRSTAKVSVLPLRGRCISASPLCAHLRGFNESFAEPASSDPTFTSGRPFVISPFSPSPLFSAFLPPGACMCARMSTADRILRTSAVRLSTPRPLFRDARRVELTRISPLTPAVTVNIGRDNAYDGRRSIPHSVQRTIVTMTSRFGCLPDRKPSQSENIWRYFYFVSVAANRFHCI